VLAARDEADADGEGAGDPERLRRTPHELFAGYLAEREASDERVLALFDELVDDATSPEPHGEAVAR
jgi:hypothetical protein